MTEKKFIVFTYYTDDSYWKSIHTTECLELTKIYESEENYNEFVSEEFDTYEEAKNSVSGYPYDYCQCKKCAFFVEISK